jgi:hypothetical protein
LPSSATSSSSTGGPAFITGERIVLAALDQFHADFGGLDCSAMMDNAERAAQYGGMGNGAWL